MRRDDDERSFDELSTPEKIQHVQDLWDRIADSGENVDLTPAQREELERRLREHEENPGELTSLDELRRQIMARFA